MSIASFDYIVVGGGTAGLVVAARLAEDQSVTVAVLEAGEDLSGELDVQIPGFTPKIRLTKADWAFMSTPQATANNQPIYIPRGKGLGGTSNINFMQLGRAPAHEYDAFEALGATGWNSAEFLKYFKKSSQLNYPDAEIEAFGLNPDKETHGDGPIVNTLPRTYTECWPQFVKACEEVGLPYNPNAIGGENIGVWPSANAIHPKTAKRVSSATAYYKPVKHQKNLVVITGAQVTRLIFENAVASGDRVAEAVEYQVNGQSAVASVKKEVILSAGSIQTPQILELSGIGDQDIVESHGIQNIIHLPGEHFGTYIVNEIDDKYESFDELRQPERAAQERMLYEQEQRGMLATIPLQFGFVPLKTLSDSDKIRKLASKLSPGNIHPPSFDLLQSWLKSDSDRISPLEAIFVPHFLPTTEKCVPDPGKKYLSLGLYVTHPFARGSVHINSGDPLAPPNINLSAFDNPVDLSLLVSAIRFARKIFSTAALKDTVTREVLPGPSIQDDIDLEGYIKRQVNTSYHPLGTASMLPREEGGVVDPNLKVYGTRNIRIVDASIIPIQIAAHPMSTIYAIAEKAADIIKAHHA